MPPNNKDEWGRCDQEHGEPWRQHAKRRKPNRTVMGSVVLFIQNVRSRKVRRELAGAVRDGHGRWLLMASLGSLVLLGDPHTRQASPLSSSYSPSPRGSFSGQRASGLNSGSVYTALEAQWEQPSCVLQKGILWLICDWRPVFWCLFYFDLFLISQN